MAVHAIRADEATITKLKELAEKLCLTQGQALDELIGVYEGQKLIESAPSRQAELDRFHTAQKTIYEIYQHSVTLWLDADEQARATVGKQLQYLKESNSELLRKNTALEADLTVAKARIEEQKQEIQKLKEQIAQTESLNDILKTMQSALSKTPAATAKNRKKSPAPEQAPEPENLDIEDILTPIKTPEN